MRESRKLVRLVVCLMGICFVLTLGDMAVQRQAKSTIKTKKIQYRTSKSTAGSAAHNDDGSLEPLYDFLIHHKLHTFCKLLRNAGIENDVKGFGASWTLFVPIDASFIFLSEEKLEDLEKNPSLLRDFILYHFIVGDFPSTHIHNEMVVDSAQGSHLRFNVYGKIKTVSGSVILEPDLLFEMGRVHIVDRPLDPIPVEDILTYLQRNHKEMYKFLVDDDVVHYLSGGTFTILAPDDEAFHYLEIQLKDKLMTNVSLAQRILLNHILPGSVYVGGITDGMQRKTAGGNHITFNVRRGLTFANDIPIVLPDIPFTNGVIHIVNRVLLPEDIEADCQCKLSSGLNTDSGEIFDFIRFQAHGLESSSFGVSGLSGNLRTLYARDPVTLQTSYSTPTSISYRSYTHPQHHSGFTISSNLSHVQDIFQPGALVTKPGALVTKPGASQEYQTRYGTPTAPVKFTRQTLYEVVEDPTLLIAGTSATPRKFTRRTLYEIVKDPTLKIGGHPEHLTKILELFHKAGIENLLQGPGPMTVFLPSDEAFGSLPKGTIEHFERNSGLLQQVLLHHVTHSEILPSVQPRSFIQPSLEGNNLLITMEDGGKRILISGAQAIAVTKGSNGILYVINRLLYPLPQPDIVSAIKSRHDLSTLAHLIPLSGLGDVLRGHTPHTLLAPTDTAFARLPHPVYNALIRNKRALQDILRNHIIEGAHYGPEFSTLGTFSSARGGKLKFEVNDYGYKVNGINVKTPVIVTGNGVIYLTDNIVFEKPDLHFITAIDSSFAGKRRPVFNEHFTVHRSRINQPQIGTTITTLAQPLHDRRVPVLSQVVPGASLRSTVTGAQSSAHELRQRILGLPFGPTVGGKRSSTQGMLHLNSGQQSTHIIHAPSGDLAHIVQASPMLHKLNEATKSANLAWILSDADPMTFFAPSDTAFNTLTANERNGLIHNKHAFTDLLKRHIVRGTYFSNGIHKSIDMKSENDKAIKLALHKGIFYVNAVPVAYPDIAATNGVLHVIDRFL